MSYDDNESESRLLEMDAEPSTKVSNGGFRLTFSTILKVLFLFTALVPIIYLFGSANYKNPIDLFGNGTMGMYNNYSGYPYHNFSGFPHQNFHFPKDESYKYILLFSDFYDNDRNWYLGTDYINDTYFENLKCPQTKCIITSDRAHLFGGITDFDALLFFAHNKMDMREFPFNSNSNSSRRAEQLYVVGMLETPPHTWRTFERDYGIFNWTMSYRFESDVFWPYGYFVENATDNVIAPALQPIWRQLEDNHFNRSYFHNETMWGIVQGKTKMAAWFVSNCDLTPSKRMNVAKAMQKFVRVDIYGRCGSFKCPKSQHNECQLMLQRDYKFYLSFENSLCLDYITEKVFSNMNYFIIPVLYNAADNSRFLPPGSYLNVLDYGTIKELTDHMSYLAAHPEEYIKYFWWKEFYYIRLGYNFCDLCVKIHEQGLVQRRQYYWDLDDWYRNKACIPTPVIPLS